MDTIEQQIESLTELFSKGILPEKLYHERLNKLLDAKLAQPIPQSAAKKAPPKEKISPEDWDWTGSSEDIAIYPVTGTVLRQRYELQSQAGQGGMGIVYKALDKEASEAEEKPVYCAIKILAPILKNDAHAINSLKREALRCKQLRHENIVQVYDFDSNPQWIWLNMEWLEGKSLANRLAEKLSRSDTGFSEQEVVKLLPSLGRALYYAHQKGIIHRDIKPANIFQCSDGRLVIVDFGIARIISNTLSRMSQQQAQASGTYEYMPPEAFIGGHKAHVRDDIYGLAVTLYELLSGERPYSGLNVTNRTPEIEKKLARPHELSDTRWSILQQALNCEAEQRPETIKYFIQAFLQTKVKTQTKAEKQRQPKIKPKTKPETKKAINKESIIKASLNTIQTPETWQCPQSGIEFIKVKVGSFLMGSPEDEVGRKNNEFQHRVTLSKDYYLGKYAVTQGQWKKVMKGWFGNAKNPSSFKDCGEDCPVETVSWDDVQEFIKKLNKLTNNQYGYCLPSEAQWEYACRAGTRTPFSFGEKITPEQVNYGTKAPVPVGNLPANGWGFYEMHGNVWEWVRDWYDASYYKNSPESDPAGPLGGSYRGIRGGSWRNTAGNSRSANRIWFSPYNRDNDLGFRLTRSFS